MRPPDTPCLAAKSCRVNAANLYWPDVPVLVSERDQEDNYYRILLALVLRMVEESMDWIHLSIHLGKRERQRIQGFCLMLWNSPHCPYVSKTLTLPSGVIWVRASFIFTQISCILSHLFQNLQVISSWKSFQS